MARATRSGAKPKPGARLRTWFENQFKISAAPAKVKKAGGTPTQAQKKASRKATLELTATLGLPAAFLAGVVTGGAVAGVNDSNTAEKLGTETGVAMAREDAKTETGFREISKDDINTDVEGLPGAFKGDFKDAYVESYNGYIEGYNKKTGQENKENQPSAGLNLVSENETSEGTDTAEQTLEDMKAKLKEEGKTDAYIKGFDAGYSDTATQSESQIPEEEKTLEEKIEGDETFAVLEQLVANDQTLLQILRGSERRINQIDEIVSVTFDYTSNGMGNVELIVKGSGNGQKFLSVSNIPVVTTSYNEAIASLQSNLLNTNEGESISPTIYINAVSLVNEMAGVKLSVDGQEVNAEDVYGNIQYKKAKGGGYIRTRSAIAVTEDSIYKTAEEKKHVESKNIEEDFCDMVGYKPVAEDGMSM